MGAWAPTSFGNDAALDLLLRLEALDSVGELQTELELCFDRYALFESKRAQGTNMFVATEDYIDGLLSSFDPAYLDDAFIARFRSRIGSVTVDDGAHEANEAIAAGEIVLACATASFVRIPEDGQFLTRIGCRISQSELTAAIQALESIKLNRGFGPGVRSGMAAQPERSVDAAFADLGQSGPAPMSRQTLPIASRCALEVTENLTMSTVLGRSMNAARWYWRPMVALQAELQGVVEASGVSIAMPKGVRTLGIEIRFSNHTGFAPDDCYFEDPKESIYQACIHLDGRRLHEGMPDDERYWTLWWLCLDALIHVVERFALPATTKATLVAMRERAVMGPPWPPIPAATHADAVASPEAAPPTSPPSLPHDAGELWVHVQGDDVDAIIEALCDMVSMRGLGEWSGDSHGSGSSDVSFDVEDMNRAGQEISSFLREAWPIARFLVSDRYEPEAFG